MELLSQRVSFIVFGRPQQRGSKRAVLIPKRGGGWLERNGRPVVAARDMNERSKDWMALVAAAGRDAYQGDLLTGPIRLSVVFYFRRPRSHYGKGRNAEKLKESAPQRHAQSPDLAKLMRALEDALTGQVWRDDRQVCWYGDVRREWTREQERAEVVIEELQ